MPIVKPGVNARPVGFRFQLADVVVRVSRVGGRAVYREFHIRRAKEILQRLGNRAGGAPMSGGEFLLGRGGWAGGPSGGDLGLPGSGSIAALQFRCSGPETGGRISASQN